LAVTLTSEGATLASAPERLSYLDVPIPATGEVAQVADGVHWIRMPLPMDLDHINLWLIEHDGGEVLVDTGFAADVCRDAWHALEANALAGRSLELIFVTHVHPDHAGLAAWLQSRHEVPVWMSRATREHMRFFLEPLTPEAAEAGARFFAEHGALDVDELRGIISGGRYRELVSGLPEVGHYPGDEERIRWNGGTWQVLECAGHIEGHLCLHDGARGVLVSGDQVLPTISSNVSLTPRSVDADPLGSYLASLRRLSALPDHTLVLPSHGRPFRGLQARTADLITHHEEHLRMLVEACRTPLSAQDVLPLLFRRSLRGLQRFLALGEAIAHLEHLAQGQRLARRVGPGGAVRFVAA
jgi:glyoxylase-like metal-dependent hydrolase (beta-lactamase superfamily II)